MTRAFLDGNKACAEATRIARPHVISAYPITPQTSVVEKLADFINDGLLNAKMVRVESEHSALSVCVGASLTGARTFTATSSQGLQLMSEVLYFASGLRLPIVMAVANRTLSTPVNIWCDHQDSLVNRDSGWIQLYASNPQEVYDYTIQAFKITENPDVLLPAMVCYDGFFVSHVSEVVELIDQKKADAFLPSPSKPKWPTLDVDDPMQFGEVVYPDWYPEIEYKKHMALVNTRDAVEKVGNEFGSAFGRQYDLIDSHECEDADIIFIVLGSIGSTCKWVVNELRAKGEKIGVAILKMFRPFPGKELMEVCRNAKLLAVLDRDIGYGTAGMVFPDVTRTYCNSNERPKFLNFIVGLGGKDVVPKTIFRCLEISRMHLESDIEKTVYWPDSKLAAEEGNG